MPLTDTAIKNAKAREKTHRLYDERGLYGVARVATESVEFDPRKHWEVVSDLRAKVRNANLPIGGPT